MAIPQHGTYVYEIAFNHGFQQQLMGLQWFVTILFVFRDNKGNIYFNLHK